MSIDLIPLAQLPSRYGIARSNLYNRIKDLKIESVKQGRKALVNAEQLELLDGLHAHLERGGTTLGFIQLLKKRGYQLTHDSTVNSPVSYSEDLNHSEPTISLNSTALVNVIETVIETVIKRIVPQSTRRLTYLEELESAYQNGWLLSTSEVSDLLGLTSKTIASYGQEFSDAGFVFARSGTRKGGEIAWSVDKQSDWTRDSPSSTRAIQAAFSDAFDPE
jgi:DNA-binding Lrp family transcriptional regulator